MERIDIIQIAIRDLAIYGFQTKLNFILGPVQSGRLGGLVRLRHPGGPCSRAEIQAGTLWRWLLVNTDWAKYKIQSVLGLRSAFKSGVFLFILIRLP